MNTTDLSIYDNSWYKPGPLYKRLAWIFVSALFFQHPLAVFGGLKVFLLRRFGAKVGKGVLIKPSVTIKYPWFLQIGSHVWIGENVWIDNLANIIISDNVCISQGAMLLTGNHNYKASTFDLVTKGIVLEVGVWVGAQSTVCPGLTLYSHAVLSAGSVATKNLDAYTIYQGNPAVAVKKREIS